MIIGHLLSIIVGIVSMLCVIFVQKRNKKDYCEFWGITEEQLDIEIELLQITQDLHKATQKFSQAVKGLNQILDDIKYNKTNPEPQLY